MATSMTPPDPPSLAMLQSAVSSIVPLYATKTISLQSATSDATVCHPAVPVTIVWGVHNAVPHAVAACLPWLLSVPNLASCQFVVDNNNKTFFLPSVAGLLSPTLAAPATASPHTVLPMTTLSVINPGQKAQINFYGNMQRGAKGG